MESRWRLLPGCGISRVFKQGGEATDEETVQEIVSGASTPNSRGLAERLAKDGQLLISRDSQDMSTTATRWTGILLFLVAVITATLFNASKIQALGFHTRDYPYFLQFAAKAFDSQRPDHYALNPCGSNFLGNRGCEGTKSLYHSIHFAPIKFVYALLYNVAPAPITVLIFIAIFHALPVLYLVFVLPARSAADRRWLLLVATFLVVCPTSLEAVSYDARTFSLLAPAFLMLVLSIHVGRPFRETLFFFILLLLVREEALVLAATAIAFNGFRNNDSTRPTMWLCGIWMSWLGSSLGYFHWAEFPVDRYSLFYFIYRNPFVYLLLMGVGLVLFERVCRRAASPATQVAPYCTVFVPLGIYLLRANIPEGKWGLYVFAFVILCMLLWDGVQRTIVRTPLQAVFSLLVAGSILVHATSTTGTVRGFAVSASVAKLVHDLRAMTDPNQTHILCDYSTYQAFFDYENVYVYNRLPSHLIPDDRDRHYPHNLPVLRQLIHHVEYVVISRESERDIRALLESTGTTPLGVENSRYTLLTLR